MSMTIVEIICWIPSAVIIWLWVREYFRPKGDQ